VRTVQETLHCSDTRQELTDAIIAKKRRIHLFFQYVTILSSEPEDLHIFHKHKIFDLIGPVPSRLDL